MNAVCTHLDHVLITGIPSLRRGLRELPVHRGNWLRCSYCLTCGHVGCCRFSQPLRASACTGCAESDRRRSSRAKWNWCT